MNSRVVEALDSIIEGLVVPSFTSIGPALRRRLFQWQALNSYDLSGQVIVLTGGTSGIGEEGARLFAACGATLVIVARNAAKTAALLDELRETSGNQKLDAVEADLGDQQQVREAARQLADRYKRIDVLIHNAGALYNTRKRAANGTDLAVELMVASPFLLTGLLLSSLRKAAPARVLTMSSGGMYTQALTVDDLQMSDEDYQGAKQYAKAKRAQVVLNELWAQRMAPSDIVFHSLHPGWHCRDFQNC